MRLGFGTFLEEDETVEKVFRRSFFLALANIIRKAAFWGGISYALYFVYPKYNQVDLTILWEICVALGLYQVLSVLAHWYYNAILLTNESVTFIYWDHLFHRSHSRIDFPNLDSIEIEKKGFRSFLGNFGNVYFHKVGGGEPVLVPRVGNPKRMVRKIESWKEHVLSRHNFSEESALKGLLSNMVKTHIGHKEYSHEEVIDRFHRNKSEELFKTESEEEYHDPNQYTHAKKKESPLPSQIPSARTQQKVKEGPDINVEKNFDNEGGISIDLGED